MLVYSSTCFWLSLSAAGFQFLLWIAFVATMYLLRRNGERKEEVCD